MNEDENAEETYNFKIANNAHKDVNFQLSLDGQNWESCSLKNNYYGTWKYKQLNIQFRLTTNNQGTVNYNISYNEGYKIQWNDDKSMWDLYNY